MWKFQSFSLLLFLVFTFNARGITLNEYIKSYGKENPSVKKLFVPNTNLFIPLESLEYVYSRQNFDKPYGYDGTDIIKLNFKPFGELAYSAQARRLTRVLSHRIVDYQFNSNRSIQYQKAIEDLIENRIIDVISENKLFLKNYLHQQKNLAASDPQSLKKILDLQSRVEFLNQSQSKPISQSLSKATREQLIDSLSKNVGELAQHLNSATPSNQTHLLEKASLDLDKVNDEMKQTGILKGVTHFEIRDDRQGKGTTYRVGISYPLDAFGDEDKRKEAQRLAKEVQLVSEQNQLNLDLLQSKKQLSDLAVTVKVLQNRMEKLKKLSKNNQPSNIRAASKFLIFETQIELLEKNLDFYLSFIDTLSEHSLFASYKDKNLLLPSSWKELDQ